MSKPLIPPPDGVTVRMYRQGHGDCFLLAFPRKDGGKAFYLLIDCGLKPGSQNFIHPGDQDGTFRKGPTISEIVGHIGEATDNHLDLVVITHEHQDHVNGIWKKGTPYFENITIDKAWFAWTEDPKDDLANTLRARHKDQLLGLVEARRQLALAADEDSLRRLSRLDSLLAMETGSHDENFNAAEVLAATKDPSRSINKQGLKHIKDKASANKGVEYLRPGEKKPLPSTDFSVYVLGPPQSETLLTDEDPKDNEAFPDDDEPHGFSFRAAALTKSGTVKSPFDTRFHLSFADPVTASSFVNLNYGDATSVEDDTDKSEVTANAAWRRIDKEWLLSAENLALQLNTGINNTSLVLAFEMPESRKVLFFAGDAQRGNWVSWANQTWGTGVEQVTTRDLLGRTVLYKVGHHGSHNATLAGKTTDGHPNLSWMGQGKYAAEFTAMITAVREWAMTKNDPPWRHPLPSILSALEQKTNGRIFQTDKATLIPTNSLPPANWDDFIARSTVNDLYFDYIIRDV
jgi:hypothetical protein